MTADLLLEALLAPWRAVRQAAGKPAPLGAAFAIMAAGSLGSSLAAWVVSGHGLSRPAATAASVAGRLCLDLAVWAAVAALLGLAAGILSGGSRGGANSFLAPVACAAAPRLYLLPLAAALRVAGRVGLVRYGRLAVWVAVVAGVWVAVREVTGAGGRRAALVMLLGIGLPVALVAAGLALSGLGWVLAPLFPDGFTPFVPL